MPIQEVDLENIILDEIRAANGSEVVNLKITNQVGPVDIAIQVVLSVLGVTNWIYSSRTIIIEGDIVE